MKRLFIAFLTASSLALMGCADAKTEADKDAAVPPLPADAGPQASGHNANATVPGGVKASSPNYKLMSTTGKGENSPSSPNYKVRSGVIGASQE